MRTKLATFAVVCLVALPLVAATNAPTPAVDEVPNLQTAPAEAAVVPEAPVSTALETSLVEGQAWGRCSSDAYCIDWCAANYGSPYGFCSSAGYCICVI